MYINRTILINAMSKNDMKQSDLARGAGLTNANVSRIINGKQGVNISTVNKLSKCLAVKPQELII